MTTEYFIAFVILVFLSVVGLYCSVKLSKAEDVIDELQDSFVRQEDIIREQWGTIEELEQELAKKNSLISILRNEIEEKENAK